MLKIPFRVIIPNIDETLSSAVEKEQIPELLASEKVGGDVEEPVVTDEEKCYEAGGTYYDYWEGELTCYRIVDCAPKPANTEWSGAYSYFEYYDYDSDTWTDYEVSHSTEYDYNGEAQTCQFICTEGFDWNGFAVNNNISMLLFTFL